MVESLWKNIKHRDLAELNRPRLDLVTHLVIENVLPRALRTLAQVRGELRSGRAKPLAGWQIDMRGDWLDMSKSDERRLVERELMWLRQPANIKGRAERLAEVEEEKARPHGTYATDMARWTCSCPAYLISRFLLCKHLVRLANEQLGHDPITNLRFFLDLRRQHYPPFYRIPGIHHDIPEPPSNGDLPGPSGAGIGTTATVCVLESGIVGNSEGADVGSDGVKEAAPPINREPFPQSGRDIIEVDADNKQRVRRTAY